MGFLSAIKSIGAKTLDIISAPLSKPKVTFTQGLSAGAQAVKESRQKISSGDKKEAAKVIGTTLLTTGAAAVATLAAAGGAAGGAAGAAARSGVVAASKSKIAKSVALTGAGLAVFAPKTFKAVTESPALAKTVVATAINPVLGAVSAAEQGSSIFGTALKVGGGVAAAGVAVAGATALAKGLFGKDEGGVLGKSDEVVIPTNQEMPSTTPMTTINGNVSSVGVTRRKYKRRKSQQPQNRITQKVNVVLSNQQNKRYLNKVYNY